MDRRQFLAASASTTLASAAPEPFRYRGYLGWITDLATAPDTHAAWPSMRLDNDLLRDYRQTFALMREWELDDLCVWGLYVSRAWPLDLSSAVTPARAARVEKLIDEAHRQGVRVISGLGVYSWGFEEILKAHPGLMKGNARAMCGSEDASWEWMRKVIDFVFRRFPIDGVSMQSADQGRCSCERCSRYTETEYHARLNIRCADYIRATYPGKHVAVSGWGMRFDDPASIPHLAELGKRINYLIDVRDSSRQRDPAQRKRIIDAVGCAFGTIGGPQVEPPQHWRRDRWFLPTVRAAGEHLEQLHGEGGRACEWFYHILANPGCELTTWVVARVLGDPAAGWRRHLDDSLERLYQVRRQSTRDALAEAFLAAEEAYVRHIPGFCGTISLEPLVSSEPGPPVYLTERIGAGARAAYAKDLAAAGALFEKLLPEVPEKPRMRAILHSIANVERDIASL
ncbi:MAG: hypothetical protein R2729_07335 [Bryobacteraceae bacterium]